MSETNNLPATSTGTAKLESMGDVHWQVTIQYPNLEVAVSTIRPSDGKQIQLFLLHFSIQ